MLDHWPVIFFYKSLLHNLAVFLACLTFAVFHYRGPCQTSLAVQQPHSALLQPSRLLESMCSSDRNPCPSVPKTCSRAAWMTSSMQDHWQAWKRQ